MGIISFDYKRLDMGGGFSRNSLTEEEFNKFNSNVLGLGEISRDGKLIQGLAAIFDLDGFTDFCNQMESHIVVPEYLSIFLSWLFNQISAQFKAGEKDDRIMIRGSLPIFAKFLGDGVLFLWDTSYSGGLTGIGNIIISLRRISKNYLKILLPELKNDFIKPPNRLRCGIARGQIIAIGNGGDFVGTCINVASRLQKISQLSFSFSRRGFDAEKGLGDKNIKLFCKKKIEIRGIGEEIIYVEKNEFDLLSEKDKLFFE